MITRDALVLDEHVADLGRRPDDDVEPARREAGLRARARPGGAPRAASALAGFSTTAQPAASAGAILCATRLSGKLNGVIAPTTPIGAAA